jgi:hypothetical protein
MQVFMDTYLVEENVRMHEKGKNWSGNIYVPLHVMTFPIVDIFPNLNSKCSVQIKNR